MQVLKWLLTRPKVTVFSVLDIPILFVTKLLYLSTRVTIRLVLGKKKRERFTVIRKLREVSEIGPLF